MQDCCKVPRPLSLSSDDLLHEAERMFATKFVSRFPSSENIRIQNNSFLPHLVTCDLNSDLLASSEISSDIAFPSSSSVSSVGTHRDGFTPNRHLTDDAPTIEDDEYYHSPFIFITEERLSSDSISPTSVKFTEDPHAPPLVQSRVDLVMYKWGPIEPMNPERFFLDLLASRGYDNKLIPALTSQYNSSPLPEQIRDYDLELINAIKNSNLDKIRELHGSGRSMSACNRFSESIVHMACRKATFEVAEFVLHNGGDCNIVDDYGRTPLHDACWRMEPRFDIVTLLLNTNLELLRIVDIRGSTPLKYVREEHWMQWCAYFHHMKEKYWAVPGICKDSKRARRI